MPIWEGEFPQPVKEFGFTNALLADENGVLICGHGRYEAAKQLGLDEVPVMVATGWTEQQKRAYRLADNQLALKAGWDVNLLKLELTDLQAMGANLQLIGFEGNELAELLADREVGLTDPDDVPEPLAKPVTILGDAWLVGRHRIVCGDCTSAEVVASALNGARPSLMATDPPYGVSYDPEWRNKATGGRSKRTGKVENDDRADWREAWALFKGSSGYIWHGALHARVVAESLEACGFEIRAQIIWAKERLVMGRGHYHWQHEPCFYVVRGTGHWSGDRKQTTLWQIPNKGQDTDTIHSTQKPVECMMRPIMNNSVAGEAVYEPFCGSGTTIIAAEMSGRVCHAIELNPIYVDIAIRRWQNFTGEVATLEHTGASFAAVAADRGVSLDTSADGPAG